MEEMSTYVTDDMNNYIPNYVRFVENSLINKLGFSNDMYCSAVLLVRKNSNITIILKIFHTNHSMKEKKQETSTKN